MIKRWWHAVLMATALAALVGAGVACSDDKPASDAAEEDAPADTADADGGSEDDGADDGGGGEAAAEDAQVPNACEILDSDDIGEAFGTDPGEGTANSVDPTRTICQYESNVVFGVSNSDQFEPGIALARDNAECEDVADVADQAVFCVTGGAVGQLIWLDGDLMYDLTSLGTDVEAFTSLVGHVHA